MKELECQFNGNIFKPALEHIFRNQGEEPSMWIFGYGSLIWNPGIRYRVAIRGYVEDYDRKFWQGNFTHRGSRELPGRVVTIVPEEGKRSFGLVFKVSGLDNIIAALEHLYVREIKSGYKFQTVRVKCMDPLAEQHHSLGPPNTTSNQIQPGLLRGLNLAYTSDAASTTILNSSPHTSAHHKRPENNSKLTLSGLDLTEDETIEALTCVAMPENCYFVGPGETMDSVAGQIAQAEGPAGYNSEYLLKLAESMKGHFPGVPDGHLFELETLVYDHLIRMSGSIDCVCDIRGVKYLPGERVRLPPLPQGLTENDLSL
jgi:cation transport regulator ChaC